MTVVCLATDGSSKAARTAAVVASSRVVNHGREIAPCQSTNATTVETVITATAPRLMRNVVPVGMMMSEDLPPLTSTMTRGLPGGGMDDSTYEQIETALDRVLAPITSEDGRRWLTLPERILALAAEFGRHPE